MSEISSIAEVKLDPPNTGAEELPKKKGGWPKGKPRGKRTLIPSAAKLDAESPKSLDATHPVIADDEVGRAIAGAFMLTSLPLGPHWRLFPHEEYELGRCFGPIARRYPEKLSGWMDLLMVGPVVGAVVIPRIKLEQLKVSHGIKDENSRDVLKMMLAMIEQEKKSNAEQVIKDGQAYSEELDKRAEQNQRAENMRRVNVVPGTDATPRP